MHKNLKLHIDWGFPMFLPTKSSPISSLTSLRQDLLCWTNHAAKVWIEEKSTVYPDWYQGLQNIPLYLHVLSINYPKSGLYKMMGNPTSQLFLWWGFPGEECTSQTPQYTSFCLKFSRFKGNPHLLSLRITLIAMSATHWMGGSSIYTQKIDWYGTNTSKPVGAEVIKPSTLGSDLISNDEFRTHDLSFINSGSGYLQPFHLAGRKTMCFEWLPCCVQEANMIGLTS